MEYQVYFTTLANADIDEIIDHIAQDSPENALNFVDTLQERIQTTLGTFPNGGSAYKDFHYISFDNYIVVYHLSETDMKVFVHLVSEGHRQWRSVLDKRQ